MSSSVRGVEALSYVKILWHSSIEREGKLRIRSMPKYLSERAILCLLDFPNGLVMLKIHKRLVCINL
jgi:hypothetical protein